jgi:hypothetical protein
MSITFCSTGVMLAMEVLVLGVGTVIEGRVVTFVCVSFTLLDGGWYLSWQIFYGSSFAGACFVALCLAMLVFTGTRHVFEGSQK